MTDEKELDFYEWLDKDFNFERLFGCCDYFDAVDEIIKKSNLNCNESVKSLIYSVVSLTKTSVIHALSERLKVEPLAIANELSFDRFCDIKPTSLNSFKKRVELRDLKIKIKKLNNKIKELEQEDGNK